MGFFNYFQSYIPRLAEVRVPLTILSAEGQPKLVVWTDVENQAFAELKHMLCECVKSNLYTVQCGKPFGLHTDASDIAIGSCLDQ